MTNHQKMTQNEAIYFNEIATGIRVDDDMVRNILSYDSPAPTFANRLPRLKSRLRQSLRNVKGARVLVYGCGTDSAALWFAKEGADVDAIDISHNCIENQKTMAATAGLNINAFVMDAHNLDFPSETYDIVYGNAILHHLSIEMAACEFFRVLKPGGIAVFRDVMRGNFLLRLFRRATPFWRTPDEKPLTKEDFHLLTKKCSNIQIDQFILTGLPYFFFVRIVNDGFLKKLGIITRLSVSDSLYALFDKIDLALFRYMPFLKNQAWLCLITLTK
jgi:ubiquinone/menaquinone biosynthesis C-methylase UbiE